jgi:uncharacterized protein YjlB
MPNNDHFPVLLYRRLQVRLGADPATRFEELFTRNGWPPQWRDGVYDFHHYHSTAHEVLGFAGGSARLMLGGENGREVVVRAGDVALCLGARVTAGWRRGRISSSCAYPPGQEWDICKQAPDDQEAVARMAALPFPPSEPVWGNQAHCYTFGDKGEAVQASPHAIRWKSGRIGRRCS